MDTKNYKCHLVGVRDKIRGKIINLGADDSLGAYARNVIPQYKELYPLNDLEIIEMGTINPFTGEIEPKEIKVYDWKELYNFNVTNKAVKNESEVTEESDKQ